jgi:hypothetical protein
VTSSKGATFHPTGQRLVPWDSSTSSLLDRGIDLLPLHLARIVLKPGINLFPSYLQKVAMIKEEENKEICKELPFP